LHDALEDECHFCSYLLSAFFRAVLAGAPRSLIPHKGVIDRARRNSWTCYCAVMFAALTTFAQRTDSSCTNWAYSSGEALGAGVIAILL